MLQTKNLVKIYKPKKGVPVRALDGVSLKFPEKGMVFLLGKSGSGKSTLLNVLGGLDKYDDGEIIIKEVSSKDFSQKHFDSYRNTYVGFIFQEYNILEEFTVGANIALALELQGKKATDEELNRILNEVDLAGFGNRRPNELSGGQKQRVAIARALVKNPKIIMADEPTGALDSATGKQVLDTLKRLSTEKLVIVVSHDREFANHYADRIIELADGKVISDTIPDESANNASDSIVFEGTTAKIPMGYHLSEEDRKAINDYIDRINSGVDLSFASSVARVFKDTDNDAIEHTDKTPFALIKSKLSLKHSFRIGGSGLKHKKFRLVMTCLLSCIAFTLFGLIDTFSAYKHQEVLANSIYDSGISYAAIKKETWQGEDDYKYWSSYNARFTEEEIEKISADTGISFSPVFMDEYNYGGMYFHNLGGNNDGYSIKDQYMGHFSGIVEIDKNTIETQGYKLVAGEYPEKDMEIAISAYMCNQFMERGYINYDDPIDESGKQKIITIRTPADMVGKKLSVNNTEVVIVGVIDTNFDKNGRFDQLFNEDMENENAIYNYVLMEEYESSLFNDYTGMMMGAKGLVENYIKATGNVQSFNNYDISISCEDYGFSIYIGSSAKLENIDERYINWFGEAKTTLGEKEILITKNAARSWFMIEEFDEYGNIVWNTDKLKEVSVDLSVHDYRNGEQESYEGYKIVGMIDTDEKDFSYGFEFVFPDSIIEKYSGSSNGTYSMALGLMPTEKGEIQKLTNYCYTDYEGTRFVLRNPVSFELDNLNEIFEELKKVFFWIGFGFALFASFLLSNFIATSISYKKQEIGILRAIGSRGNDVFRIFFAEAFIIAMINLVLACIGTGVVTAAINTAARENVGLLITVLTFDLRQVALLLVISVAVAFIASFIPVKKVAAMRPIDAIKSV